MTFDINLAITVATSTYSSSMQAARSDINSINTFPSLSSFLQFVLNISIDSFNKLVISNIHSDNWNSLSRIKN